LWIIAISLLTIAVCLVLLAVKQHFIDPDEAPSADPLAVAEKPATFRDRHATRYPPALVRRTPGSQTAVEHPFFAITDTNGNFVIPNVPAGKYTLRALHRKAGATNELPREVTLNSGEIVAVNFTLVAPGD